jgi:hypothetical protein
MKHEHVNTAHEIEEIVNHFFKKCKCSCFGFGKKIAFYRFYECSEPDVESAENYLVKNLRSLQLNRNKNNSAFFTEHNKIIILLHSQKKQENAENPIKSRR